MGLPPIMEWWNRDFLSVTVNHGVDSRIVRSLTAPMVYQSARPLLVSVP